MATIEKRLLVFGHPRSGTSILARLLTTNRSIVSGEFGTYMIPTKFAIKDCYRQFLIRIEKDLIGRNLAYKGSQLAQDIKDIIETTKTRRDIILRLEPLLYPDHAIVGDKWANTPNKSFINNMLNTKLPFHLIYIHRDGRDVMASRYQALKTEVGKREWWATDNLVESGKTWLRHMNDWHNIYKEVKDKIPILVLSHQKIWETDQEIQRLAQFTDIPFDQLIQNKERLTISRKTVGYYKDYIPDWSKFVSPEFIQKLEELGYE